MSEYLDGVGRQLLERYPLLTNLALSPDGADAEQVGLPLFVGVLLSILENGQTGAACTVLPTRTGIGLAVALLGSLSALRRSFDELELDRLTTPFRKGGWVRVAPEDRVYQVVEDGKSWRGKRWILLRNPTDDQIHYMPEDEAFRLTPTSGSGRKPRKGERPGRWSPAPIDRLLGIRTGGNLAVVPNKIILVAPRRDTADLAESTRVSGGSCDLTSASDLITWGRITRSGQVVSEDGPREPMIAVTHSVDLMAMACRQDGVEEKLIIVDGARGLASNLQAFDDVVNKHRLLVLADHSELDHVAALDERQCEVWSPDPDVILGSEDSRDRSSSWFSALYQAAGTCRDFQITPIQTTDGAVEGLHEALEAAEGGSSGDDDVQRLLGQGWSLLLTVAGWLEPPGSAALEYFDRRVTELRKGLQQKRMWIAPEVAAGLEQFLTAADAVRRAEELGLEKRKALLNAIADDPAGTAVVTRSVPGAARIRSLLERSDFDVPVYPISSIADEYRDRVIMCSWPGRRLAYRLTSRYRFSRVDVLCYPFEEQWLSPFAERWSREWTRYRRTGAEVETITGLSSWPADPQPQTQRPFGPEHEPEEDPISRILSRRRKGGSAVSVSANEAREARYVGFHGDGYSFLTEGHKVPVVTDLVLGGGLSDERVPLRPVRKMVAGDFVLFRDHGDQDVISLIAEHEVGEATYQELRRIANLWRPALRSIGSDADVIWRRLRRAGLERSLATVRVWLTDGDRIGPRSEADLEVIATASGDDELADNLDAVSAAIREVWSAHIRAGFTLSDLLLRELPSKIPEIDEGGRHVNFTFGGGWILCIDEIADAPEERPYWEVNRLLFDEEG